ncbi:hypothetical protein E2C01_073479 [Portunus trituberculatus]|uniref:Uncharacterized protein n=1 Tax=Portunus trituberculatus TaxID=210409 RepID=A0A5B7IAN3_PORTR|nr:hypothetical protein [Portunus trituberculatus]
MTYGATLSSLRIISSTYPCVHSPVPPPRSHRPMHAPRLASPRPSLGQVIQINTDAAAPSPPPPSPPPSPPLPPP